MPPDFSFVDQVGVPAFVLRPDAQGRLVYAACNDLWCAGANLARDGVIGKTAAQIFDGPEGVDQDRMHAQAARQRSPYIQPMAAPFGTEATGTLLNLNPVYDATGRLMHVVGLMVGAAPAAAQQNPAAKLDALVPEMEAFLSFAAHDLRTPMRQVHALAELLRDGFEDLGDGKLEMIDMLEDVAVKASGLVTEILAQTQALTASTDRTRFDLAGVWDDIMAVLDPRAQHSLTAPDVTLLTDRIAVQIGLRNLVDNAIKHGGQAQTVIRLEVSEKTAGELLFEVFDNGKGFPDPAIAFLECGDLRVDSGYGLFGIKRLILSRGGTISAANLPDGTGSVVRFTLPGQMEAPLAKQVSSG